MKRIFLAILLLIFCTTSAFGAADASATAKTQALLTYLTALKNNTTNKILSGQFMQDEAASVYTLYGKYPAVVGGTAMPDYDGPAVANYVTYGNNNGIVLLTSFFDNPDDSSPWESHPRLDIPTMLTDGTTLNIYLKGKLDIEAAYIQNFEDANIPVIYHMFHEMNSTNPAYCTFWWCGLSATQYSNLWVYAFNYLTVTKGLHNILFLWAPDDRGSTPVSQWYPGNEYVDIVGFSNYGAGVVMSGNPLTMYNSIRSITTAKPMAMAEYGHCDAYDCAATNLSTLATNIQAYIPNTILWMNWEYSWSLDYNTGVSTLLADTKVITRDEVAYYETATYQLSVTITGTGTGTVTSSPGGISCSTGTCTYSFSPQSITLTAVPAGGGSVTWSGGGCSGSQTTCVIPFSAPTSVTATFTAAAASSTHWVSTTGSAPWASCAGATDPGVYCSLTTANGYASAGELVYLRGGTYSAGISPSNSGTSASNMITFKAAAAETPILTPPQYTAGIYLNGNSYIKVDGLTIKNLIYSSYWMLIRKWAHHNEIANCTFYQDTVALAVPLYITGDCQTAPTTYACPSTHNWFHGNTVYTEGIPGCGEGSNLVNLGSANTGNQTSNYNTIENNVIYHGGHATLETHTKYNVIRNNVFRNDGFKTDPGGCTLSSHAGNPSNNMYGHRNIQIYDVTANTTGGFFNLLEGNRIGYATVNPGNDGAENLSLTSPKNIARYNDIYGADGEGIYFKNGVSASQNHVYNNTIYGNGNGPSNHRAGIVFQYSSPAQMNVIKNNLLRLNKATSTPTYLDWYSSGTGSDMATQQTRSNNWCDAAADGVYCTKTGDPLFTNPDITDMTSLVLPDFTLQAGSTAINAGTNLTTAVGAGTNSTTLVVADALYFQDGSLGSDLTRTAGTMSADYIAIGTVGNTVKIASINYTTNTITLSSSKSWVNGASVWLYSNSKGPVYGIVLAGTAPDIGANEYGVGIPAGDTTAPVRGADDLAATALSYSAVNLSWTAFTDAVGVTQYRIYRCLGAACTPSEQIGVSATNSFQDTNLTASTTYGYTVKAADAVPNLSLALTTDYATTPAMSTNLEFEDPLVCTLASTITAKANENASGGYYVSTTTADSGTATCAFTVATTGTYKINIRGYAASAATDSFTIQVDALTASIYDMNPTGDPLQYGVWYNDELTYRGTGTAQAPQYDPYVVTLTAGAHTIVFTGREAGARLDYFTVVPVSITEQYTLTYTKAGTGTGTVVINGVNCSASCAYNYNAGTPISITGTAGGDSTFVGWSGGLCTGTGACEFSMTEARAVTGTFTLTPPPLRTLTITPEGTGLGTITSSPTGISCGSTCAFDFTDDAVVTLTATPGTASTFAGWTGTGGCTGTDPYEITMDAAKACTATFTRTNPPATGANFTLHFGGTMVSGGPKITLVK